MHMHMHQTIIFLPFLHFSLGNNHYGMQPTNNCILFSADLTVLSARQNEAKQSPQIVSFTLSEWVFNFLKNSTAFQLNKTDMVADNFEIQSKWSNEEESFSFLDYCCLCQAHDSQVRALHLL